MADVVALQRRRTLPAPRVAVLTGTRLADFHAKGPLPKGCSIRGKRCPRCHQIAPRSDGIPCLLCAPLELWPIAAANLAAQYRLPLQLPYDEEF